MSSHTNSRPKPTILLFPQGKLLGQPVPISVFSSPCQGTCIKVCSSSDYFICFPGQFSSNLSRLDCKYSPAKHHHWGYRTYEKTCSRPSQAQTRKLIVKATKPKSNTQYFCNISKTSPCSTEQLHTTYLQLLHNSEVLISARTGC